MAAGRRDYKTEQISKKTAFSPEKAVSAKVGQGRYAFSLNLLRR
jgi:hypothetical protein